MTARTKLLVGGGLASQRCAETLRRRGFDGPIAIVCGEAEPPYDRPPLSKAVLSGAAEPDDLRFRDQDWYRDNQVELLLGERACALVPGERRLELVSGLSIEYADLLIATGAAPRALPQLAGFANAHALRTLADARALRDELGSGTRLAIVGAGFIGQEVAAGALGLGAEVTMIEALDLPLASLLGEQVGRWLVGLHEDEGVRVRLSSRLQHARGNGRVEELLLEDGSNVACDAVVVGIGVIPATGWLAGSGLDPKALTVDHGGRTTTPHVYAAGDACLMLDPFRGRHTRTEHWDAASRQGTNAALAMLEQELQPAALPSFWSDQHGVRIQYVGHAADADHHEVDGDPASRDFSVLYSRGELPVAALAVGRPRELVALRRLIEAAHESTKQRMETMKCP